MAKTINIDFSNYDFRHDQKMQYLLQEMLKIVIEIEVNEEARAYLGAVYNKDGNLATDATDAATIYINVPLQRDDGGPVKRPFKLSDMVDYVVGDGEIVDPDSTATAESATVLRDELRKQADRIDAYLKSGKTRVPFDDE